MKPGCLKILSSLKWKNWVNTMKEIDLIIRNSKYYVSLFLSLSLSLCLSYCLPLTRSLPGQSQRSKHPWGTASSFFGWRTESLQWGSHDPPCALGHTLHSSFLLNHTHVHILKHIFSSFLKMNTNTQSLLHLDVYTFMPVKRWQTALDLMSQLFRKHSPS